MNTRTAKCLLCRCLFSGMFSVSHNAQNGSYVLEGNNGADDVCGEAYGLSVTHVQPHPLLHY